MKPGDPRRFRRPKKRVDPSLGLLKDLVPKLGAASVAVYAMLVWLPVSVDLALYVLVIVAALAIWLNEPNPGATWPWPDAFAVLIALSSAVSIALSSDVTRSLALSSSMVPVALLYLMTTRYIRTPDQVAIVFSGLSISALGVSAVVLTMSITAADVSHLVEKAAIPILVVPNDVLFLALVAPLTLSLLVIGLPGPVRWTAAVSVISSAASIVVLHSRSGLIVFAVSTAIASLGFRMSAVLKTLLVGAVSLLSLDALLGFPLLGKFASLCDNRGALWAAAWELFLEKPVFGHGPHTFKALYQSRIPEQVYFACAEPDARIAPWPHNLILELLSSQGLFGALVFSASLAWAVFVAYSATGSPSRTCVALAWGLLGALAGFTVASIVELSLLRLWVVVLFAVMVGSTFQLRVCTSGKVQREAESRPE